MHTRIILISSYFILFFFTNLDHLNCIHLRLYSLNTPLSFHAMRSFITFSILMLLDSPNMQSSYITVTTLFFYEIQCSYIFFIVHTLLPEYGILKLLTTNSYISTLQLCSQNMR